MVQWRIAGSTGSLSSMEVAYHDGAVVIRLDAGPAEQSLQSLARAIAGHLLRLREAARERSAPILQPTGLAPDKVEKVRAYVEQHIGDRVRIRQLAATVHMSPFHFSRAFKRAVGASPHGYVTQRRIERAKALLAAERLPLVHVAAAVGFQTQGHFTEVFRRHTGTTPRRYRLAARYSQET